MSNNQYLTYGGDMMIFVHTGSTKQPIAFSTSAKLSVSMKTREISSKDSGDWTEKAKGKYDWNMSTDALMNFSSTGTTMSVEELYQFFALGLPVNVAFGSKTGTSPSYTLNASKKNFTGQAYITSFDFNAGDGETASYSISLEGTGALTLA